MIKRKTLSEMVLQTNIITVAHVKLKYVFSIFSQITTLKSLMSQFNALVLLKFTISAICTILNFCFAKLVPKHQNVTITLLHM